MVPKDHFVAAENGEVYLLVRAMVVVPNTTGTGNYEEADCLDEGVAP